MAQTSSNPIHQNEEDQKWYFWDETWVSRYGPYDTEEIAREKLREYCKTL